MARVTDVRIRTSFYGNMNTKRLIKRCGAEAVIGLQKLWIHAAEHFPSDGVFLGYTQAEVEEVMELPNGEVLLQLVKLGFVNKTEHGWFEISDWETEQPWAAGAEERGL